MVRVEGKGRGCPARGGRTSALPGHTSHPRGEHCQGEDLTHHEPTPPALG